MKYGIVDFRVLEIQLPSNFQDPKLSTYIVWNVDTGATWLESICY